MHVQVINQHGVAVLTIHHPPANALHDQVLTELFKAVETCQADPNVAALVITGSNGRFSAGIDINMLDSDVDFTSDRQVVLSSMAQLMEQGPKPSVAAVEGVCLGAGLELALACTARVAARTALLGLPEVRLGLIPGLGGTQRLPRVIPLPEAINLITTGVVVSASRAQELGFVDEICGNEHDVLPIAIDLALRISQGTASRPPAALTRRDRLPEEKELKHIIAATKSRLLSQWLGPPSALLALDAVETGLLQGPEAGLEKEAQCFNLALTLSSHKALVRAFFAHRDTKKSKGLVQWLWRWLYALWVRAQAFSTLAWEWWGPQHRAGHHKTE